MDENRLAPLRRRDVLHRLLYAITLTGPDGEPLEHVVHVDTAGDEWAAELFVGRLRRAKADLPATFDVPGGAIQVDLSLYGVSRMHFVGDDGEEQRLEPLAGTLEHRRHRLHRDRPRLSRVIEWTAIVVLVVGLVPAVPQALELLTTHVDGVRELIGSFTSPIQLPAWLNTTITLAGVTAAVERALMLRRHPVVDAETIWTAF